MRVVHLVVKHISQVEVLADKHHKVIDSVRLDVAQHALTVKQCWLRRFYPALSQDVAKLLQIRQITRCKQIILSTLERTKMLYIV